MSLASEARRLAPAVAVGLLLRLSLGLWLAKSEAAPLDAWGGLSGALKYTNRVLGFIGEVATLWLLTRIWLRLSPIPKRYGQSAMNSRAAWASLAWLAWPCVAWVSAFQGHSDALILALLLYAAWMLEFSDRPRAELWASLSCGLACAASPWALLTLPFFTRALLSRRERLIFMARSLLLASPMLVIQIYSYGQTPSSRGFALGLGGAFEATLKATGAGPEALAGAMNMASHASLVILGLLWFWTLFSSWRPPLLAGLSLASLMLWVFSPHLELRQLLPALAFSLLLPGRWGLRLGLASTLALVWAVLFEGRSLPLWGLASLALLHFGFWLYACAETLALLRICSQPKGRLDYRA